MQFPSLVPKDKVFFDLFYQAGQNTLRASRLLKEMLENSLLILAVWSRVSRATGFTPA